MRSETRLPRVFYVLGAAVVVMPWMGIMVRLLTPNQSKITLAGILFWSLGSLIFWYTYRYAQGKTRWNFATSLFVWTCTFVPLFTVSVLATGRIVRSG
jgi:hypothetical protein